jgi:hypothetical protein
MTDSPDPSASRPHHPLLTLVGLTLGLGAILVLLLALFILPSLRSGASDLPVGLVGSPAAISALQEDLAEGVPGAYVSRTYASEDDLRAAIAAREVVGGLVVSDTGLDALVTSAGSAVIAAALGNTAAELAAAAGLPLNVIDVVPLPAADPSGIGIGGLTFPLVFGGIVPVVAFKSAFPHRDGWRLAGIVLTSVVSGLIVAAVLQFWFGSIVDAFWPVAGAMALGVAAMALPLAGLQQVFGGAGFTIGAMVMMFLGNPLAGIATTGAWLPTELGLVGQLLPPGATGTLVRSAAYFDWAGGGGSAITLVAWIVIGLVLTAVGLMRGKPVDPMED